MKIKLLLSKPIFWFLIIAIFGFILRAYNLSDYVQFLGDEGRDALVVKRMIVDHKFTLLGPTASVGGFYIGPLYYYMMLPFLYLSHLDPVGPAYLNVLIGTLFLGLIFFFIKKTVGDRAALISVLLASISPQMIAISRFSWNPNPMPFFALLTVICTYYAVLKKSMKYIFAAGLSVGVLQQLHYIDLVFVPIFAIYLLRFFRGKELIKAIFWSGVGFLLGYSLFLIFEVRHGFPNLRSVWEFSMRDGKTVSPRSFNLIWLFNDIFNRTFEIVFGLKRPVIDLIYFSSLASLVYTIIKKINNKENILFYKLLVVWIIVGVLGVGSYQGSLYDHYFGFLLPLPLILVGIMFESLFEFGRLSKIFLSLVLVALVYFAISKFYFWRPGNRQVEQTKTVANMVLDLSGRQDYNFALITPGNSDHAYRYFLEVWGYAPVTIENPVADPQRKSVTKQLIIVCEQKECQPLGNPLWEVAGFGRAEIANRVEGPAGIILYKLVHYKGE